MSRWRGRNDILPRLAIARHPQLATDKSAFSPLDKIALQSTPDGRAIWMECCVHDFPPTPSKKNYVSYAGMSVTRGTKITRAVRGASEQVSGAPPTRIHSAMCGQSSAYGRTTAAKSDQSGRSSSGSLAMLAAMRRASSRESDTFTRLRVFCAWASSSAAGQHSRQMARLQNRCSRRSWRSLHRRHRHSPRLRSRSRPARALCDAGKFQHFHCRKHKMSPS